MEDIFKDLCKKYDNEELALILCCSMAGWFYSEATYEKMKAKDSRINLGNYVRMLNLTQNSKGSFQDYLVDLLKKKQLLKDKKQRRNLEENSWSEEDKRIKQEVLDVVGYDPFEEYPMQDRKYLFNELVKYFDDDIGEDTYKLSQIIQIVNNNNQIRRYDLLISSLSPVTNSGEIAKLNELKIKLVTSNDKIAKENEISVKNRSNKEAGRFTLTYLQKYLRELNFDKAEADYYDQLRSDGSLWAIEMSLKAIQRNTFFNDDDMNDIQNIRRELVLKLQKEVDDLKEEKRQLSLRIQELEKKGH